MKGIKKILSLGLLLVFSFSMVSCGGSKENILEGTVVVTSKYPDEVNSYIAEEFKKETGISVKYEVKDEIKEDDFKNSNTDIILGGDNELYKKMASDNILKGYKTSWYSDVDDNYRDKDGYWYSIFRNPMVVAYNKANLAANLVPKIISATASYLSKEANNDDNIGSTFLQGVKLNVATFFNNYDELFTALDTKETPIGILPLDVLNKKIKDNANVTRIDFEEGVPVITECAGILKSAPNPNASELFMEFVAGPKIQLELAQKFNIMPTLPVAIKYSPDWIKNFKTLDIENNVVLENEDKWVQFFNGVVKPEVPAKTTNNPVIKGKKKS
ncbi:ABC transporter substrate-binding protein [Clostridium perfringens]|uniref:extracellular solute-binding protein n=1 Tax=Clostridium perfringens TaxID=1502 RepID=UPI002855C58C|nr:ABC transporter substrate-binding protein [Clostridium perfringens]